MQALIPLLVPLESPLYRDLFVASQAFIVAFYALVVLELYSVILRDLAGIAGVARRYIKVTLAFAILVSLLPLRIEKTPKTLTGYLFITRASNPVQPGCIRAFDQRVFGLLSRPSGPERDRLPGGLCGLFSNHCDYGVLSEFGLFLEPAKGQCRYGHLGGLFDLLAVGLNRAGENKRVVVGHHWNPGDEQRLLAQLEAINASLLRSRN